MPVKRDRRMVMLCHCIINCNSKVEGCSGYRGAMSEITKLLVDNGIGIIQLPCPEMTYYGIKRWGHVKDQFDTPYYRKHCRKIFQPYVEQLQDYISNGYEIIGLLGVEGSPSCGISMTCTGDWGGEFSTNPNLKETLDAVEIIADRGVFSEEVSALLAEKGITVPFLGIDEAEMADSVIKVNKFIRGSY